MKPRWYTTPLQIVCFPLAVAIGLLLVAIGCAIELYHWSRRRIEYVILFLLGAAAGFAIAAELVDMFFGR